jgi:hypothetical protein
METGAILQQLERNRGFFPEDEMVGMLQPSTCASGPRCKGQAWGPEAICSSRGPSGRCCYRALAASPAFALVQHSASSWSVRSGSAVRTKTAQNTANASSS